MTQLTLSTITEAVAAALRAAGASATAAQHTAHALVLAQAQGLGSHGLGRLRSYLAHLRNGRVNGKAVPVVLQSMPAALRVDAQNGLAFEACALAVERALAVAHTHGVCWAGVFRSHHAGVLVDHLRPVAEAGMVGLAFSNTPAAMPVAGGRKAVLGTNPMAAIFPVLGQDALLLDLSLTEVARGKVVAAAQAGQAIPLGWALDREGQPTTDPHAALAGSMLPVGAGAKGAVLAMMVELLATALVGGRFSAAADSVLQDEGGPPELGHAFVVINPQALSGSSECAERLQAWVALVAQEPGVRLPGQQRWLRQRVAEAEGLLLDDALWHRIVRWSEGDWTDF